MQPLLVYLFIVLAKLPDPRGCEMLGHDVFDGIRSIVAVGINVLVFQRAIVFQALQNVNLVFVGHLVDLALRKACAEFFVIRETRPFLF